QKCAHAFVCSSIIVCRSKAFHLKVQCRYKSKRPPRCMHKGSVVTDGKSAYFTPCDSTSLYKYQFDTEQWTQLVS
ncbi:hypothetical protein GBAR_LOCUS7284, partial [Geodia barretti]